MSKARPGHLTKRRKMVTLLVGLSVLFFSLGVWQLYRRAGKLHLIKDIQSKVHAHPQDLDELLSTPKVDPHALEYKHVSVNGHFLDLPNRYVRASTRYGFGYWVMSPFETQRGTVLAINRGFVNQEHRKKDQEMNRGNFLSQKKLTGLLRLSEPKGTFLQPNRPKKQIWYSRDVVTLSSSWKISRTIPYFIDLEQSQEEIRDGEPIPGLTQIRLLNNHLVYAITWFSLCLLCVGGTVILFRNDESENKTT